MPGEEKRKWDFWLSSLKTDTEFTLDDIFQR